MLDLLCSPKADNRANFAHNQAVHRRREILLSTHGAKIEFIS